MKITKDSYFLFSGGEVHYKLKSVKPAANFLEQLPENNWSSIIMKDYSMNGFMALCEHAQIIRKQHMSVNVMYPYFPYARQDRFIGLMEPFSLKIFCQLLNSQHFDKVTIVDPHSDVTLALINNVHIWTQENIAKQVIPSQLFDNDNVLFVSPDAGAYKKVSKLINDDTRICIGVKNRNDKGEITHTNVFGPIPVMDHDCIMVDDICDGGRTFIELAKALKLKGANKIYLYVTHGIFSKGLDELKESGINHIYTTNTFPHGYISDEFITVKDIV